MPRGAAPTWRKWILVAVLLVLGGFAGCANSVKPIGELRGQDPETELTYAPLDSDTTSFRVHIYWSGFDRDGEVVRFSFAIDADTTLPVPQWRSTSKKDSTFTFLVDPVMEVRGHVFMISAIDNNGFYDRSPARRFFSTRTKPPISQIVRGPSALNPTVGPAFTFEMSGSDPDGSLIGGPAWVDSFEYLLLRTEMAALPGQPQLPPYDQDAYVSLINRGVGRTLPPPYDGWAWRGIRGTRAGFQYMAPGEYVFAERAVDPVGATEKGLRYGTNIRHFRVAQTPPVSPNPTLQISCSALLRSMRANGPIDVPREAIQVLEGEEIGFSWFATVPTYGSEIEYSWALDDSSQMPDPDPRVTEVTLIPAQLAAGAHTLFVRAVDSGRITNAVIPIQVVHPTFKDPGAAREILYVDDSLGPGSTTYRVGNYPSDNEETNWWMSTILPQLGVPAVEWDTYLAGIQGVEGREPPTLSDLARFSTVIWNVDFNNGFASPTGLHKTLVDESQSHLAAYVRGGGTLILSGFSIAGNVIEPRTMLYANATRGICAGLEPGPVYDYSYFARNYMGIDGAKANDQALRTIGARDFIVAAPTSAGIGAGYDSASVDRGPLNSGAKWITYPGGDPNTNTSPGLGQVDGWLIAENFGCEPNASTVFAPENPSQPIAQPILVYHGANIGIDEEGGPSPREGMVVGVQVQAHGLGTGHSLTFDRDHSLGRMVHLAFPLYFLRDQDAVRVLQAAYNYVNDSPTLR